MRAAPAVAAIIVTYKSAALTIACLHSLVSERAASGVAVRVIVVDNASGDAPVIAAAIEQYGWATWVTLLTSPKNGGFAYGNNLGFAHAYSQGPADYLYMLNPDTVVKPGAINALVAFLEAHPDAGIAGSSFENADGSDWPIAFRFPTLLNELDTGLSIGLVSRLLRPWSVVRVMTSEVAQIDWGAGASMMLRRSMVDKIGGLDENYFLYFEETEFCWRARRAGFSMWYVPQSRIVHIGGQSTKLTERNAAPKRVPGYWFESRRRYFLTTHGFGKTLLIDLVAVVASALGVLKLALLRRQDQITPHYTADLWRHSPWHRQNRTLPAGPAQLLR